MGLMHSHKTPATMTYIIQALVIASIKNDYKRKQEWSTEALANMLSSILTPTKAKGHFLLL